MINCYLQLILIFLNKFKYGLGSYHEFSTEEFVYLQYYQDSAFRVIKRYHSWSDNSREYWIG